MNIKIGKYHFFFDGYEIEANKLDNPKIIQNILNDINKLFLKGNGKSIIIPYFGNDNLLDDGISGIIIGNQFHFTCHTFSNRNTVFVDLYHNEVIDNNHLISIFNKYFEVEKYDLCTDNNLTGNFGKHIIIKADFIQYEEAVVLIDKIIKSIEMRPIHEKIFFITKEGYDILRPIAESHVSIHCHNHESIIDVFSCNSFEEERIFQLLNNNKIYGMEKIERGIYLPKFKNILKNDKCLLGSE